MEEALRGKPNPHQKVFRWNLSSEQGEWITWIVYNRDDIKTEWDQMNQKLLNLGSLPPMQGLDGDC